jgi:hypothetical protein
VSEPAFTVTVESEVRETEPLLRSRELVPKKVKLPFQISGSARNVSELEASKVAPEYIVRVPVPSAPALPSARVPCARVVPPEYELALERVHLPVPCLKREVVFIELLLTMAPAISPLPAVEPCSTNVLEPAPVAVKDRTNFSNPVPDWSSTAPPVVPERSIARLVVSPVPE